MNYGPGWIILEESLNPHARRVLSILPPRRSPRDVSRSWSSCTSIGTIRFTSACNTRSNHGSQGPITYGRSTASTETGIAGTIRSISAITRIRSLCAGPCWNFSTASRSSIPIDQSDWRIVSRFSKFRHNDGRTRLLQVYRLRTHCSVLVVARGCRGPRRYMICTVCGDNSPLNHRCRSQGDSNPCSNRESAF